MILVIPKKIYTSPKALPSIIKKIKDDEKHRPEKIHVFLCDWKFVTETTPSKYCNIIYIYL